MANKKNRQERPRAIGGPERMDKKLCITAENLAEMKMLSFAVEESSDWILMTDREGCITYANKAVERISGYKKGELIGRRTNIFKSGLHDKSFYKELWDTVLSGRTFQHIFTDARKDGELFELFHTITPLKDDNGSITSFISTSKDVTLQKELEDRIKYLVYHDALTGLPNRDLLIDRLTEWMARSPYNRRRTAVLSISIDRFHFVIDTFGAGAGEKVMVEAGRMLSGSVRDGDTVACTGPDEFAVGLVDIADTKDVILIAEKVMENFSRPLSVGDEEVVLTISMGIAVHPGDGSDAFDLLKFSGLARSKVVAEGGRDFYFYNPRIEAMATEFVLMERDLYKALRDGELELYYQPYVEASSGKLAGVEALMRWNNRDRGLTLPGKFIPVLEDTKMIIEVGEWSLTTALRQVKDWQDKGYPVVPVSVNLSPVQFRKKDLLEVVTKTIKETDVAPGLLTLEITEGAFMQDVDYAKTVLKGFKDAGVTIAIDDFGTGYSSLSYLKGFPVDIMKIDISFIRDIATDPDAASIVNAIIAMAHSLNIKTIAEGVETEEQWKILRLLRCDAIQGFYFSKPLPAADLENLLRTSAAQST